MPLTRALINRHGGNRNDTYGAALLDVAQDHLLWHLDRNGHFADASLVFKGGTSLRKCRLGTLGRFSTDLDFNAPSDDTVLAVCESIHEARVGGFQFTLGNSSDDGRHWTLDIVHEELGRPDITASVEFARRPLALTPQRLGCEALAIHRDYGFALPTLPVIALEEACAEKLARWRRTALQRDCYDLAWYAEQILDESLIRRLWVLKVWGDVVQDGRGSKPLDPAVITTRRLPKDFQPDSMGKLTQPVELERWEQAVRTRFVFLTELDADEQHWARCDPRDAYAVQSALTRFQNT